MTTKTARKIVHIDEEKCDGCGQCVPNCAEGALRIINGKARLMAENLCDGLGACLGTCPRDAIRVEDRAAEEFDENAVARHLRADASPLTLSPATMAPALMPRMAGDAQGGCPGSRLRMLPRPVGPAAPVAGGTRRSQLGQWPVQLALVPPMGPMWNNAHVLICADCVPFAYPDFHEKLLAGRTLAIACPKLDDVGPYVEKLTRIFAENTIQSITVAHMEVPCCTGIVRAVQLALAQAGRDDLTIQDITIPVAP